MSQRGKRNRVEEKKPQTVAPTSRASTALLPMLSGRSTAGAVALSYEKAKSPVPGNGLIVLAGTYTSVIAGMVLSATGKGGKKLAGSGATSVGARSLAAQTSATAKSLGGTRSAAGGAEGDAELGGTRPLYLKFSSKHHTGSINSIAMTDKYLATSATGDEKVFLYTVKDRYSVIAELGSLNPASEVRCLAFPLAAANTNSKQNQVPVAPTGGALASLNKASTASNASTGGGGFSQGTSKFLLCGCDDGTLGAYNTRTWECELVLPVHGGFHLENQIKMNIAQAEKIKSITKGGGKGAAESAKDRRFKAQQEIIESKQLELLNRRDGCAIAAMAVWASPGTGNVLVLTAGATDRKIGIVDMSSAAVVTTLKLPAVHADPLTGRQKHFERASWNPVSIVVAPPPSSKRPQDQLFAVLTAYDVWIYKMGTMTCIGRFTTRPSPPKTQQPAETSPSGGRRAPPFVIPNPQYELTSLCWVTDSTMIVGTEDGSMLSCNMKELFCIVDTHANKPPVEEEVESSSSDDEDADDDDDDDEEDEEEDPENPFLKDPKAEEKQREKDAKKAKRMKKKEGGASTAKPRKNIGHELPCVQLIEEQQIEDDMFQKNFSVSTVVEVDPREMDDRKAAKVKSLFTSTGHSVRIRTLATVAGNKPGTSLVVSTDSQGTIAVWEPSTNEVAAKKGKKNDTNSPVVLTQVAVTNCEGRVTASLACVR